MRKHFGQFVFIVLVSSVISQAWAQTVTIGASKDNSIYEDNPTHSAGGSAGIFVGNNAGGSPRRGLLAFDIAANVPAGATITGAQLTLYLGKLGGGPDQSVELHRLNVDWGEGTAGDFDPTIAHGGQGFTAAPGDATWDERLSGSAAWANPGGAGDFNSTASASSVISNVLESPYTWLSARMAADVQSWLNTPAGNFGWMLVNANGNDDPGTVRAFYSRTATTKTTGGSLDPSARPTLTITYSVPEPSAVGLIAMGSGLVFFVRRSSRRRRES